MHRLGLCDDLIFDFPLRDAVLQIYIINCAVIWKHPNVYPTIRGKLRAIDYVAQLANCKQSWSDNPALFALIQYVKQRNPSKGSDTLSLSAEIIVQIASFVFQIKVYYGLHLSDAQKALANQWLTFPKIW